MKPRDYCCCAIPLVNAGIYLTLLEQFSLGIIAGTLSIGTPTIVGASTPAVAKWVFAIICYAGAAVQVFGYFGVLKERAIMYRRYATLHLLVTIAAFSIAAVWIAISASRHNQAKTKCTTDFFPINSDTEGDTLCDIFPWVDVGIMGGLWVLLAIVQLYLYVIVSSYGSGQRKDHEKYDSMYDATKPLTSDIPLSTRADPWDSQTPANPLLRDAGNHSRHSSVASVSTVMADKPQQPRDFGGYEQNSYPPSFPHHARTQSPGPTPLSNEYFSTGYSGGGVNAPQPSQPHPAEGSFRRKTPRYQQPQSEDFNVTTVLTKRRY